jgi:cytochrome b
VSETVGDARSTRRVEVWDLPTRLFHWSLLALVLVAWFTGEKEGAAAVVHRTAGAAVAGLLVFRLMWGLVGGEHARFAGFAAGPSAVLAHIRDLFSAYPKRHLGHNPLGGVAVFLLLINIAVIVTAGLFSGGEDNAGPFAGVWGLELSDVHEIAFRVLQGLVALHIFGVVVESWRSRDALLPAMITGGKRRGADERATAARRASPFALIVAVALGLVAFAALASWPASTTAGALGSPQQERMPTDDEHD